MKHEDTQRDITTMAMELARSGKDLVDHLSETKGKGFTDGYHKYAGDLIAAINATRGALQTALVQQALVMRAMELPDGDGLLKLVKGNAIEAEKKA